MMESTILIETASVWSGIMKELNQMRTDDILCDIQLQGDDTNSKYSAHSCVLSAASVYIRSAITSLEDKESRTLFLLHLPHIKSIVIETILSYIYEGKVCIRSSELLNLKEAAEFLLIKDLQELCLQLQESVKSESSKDTESSAQEARIKVESETPPVDKENIVLSINQEAPMKLPTDADTAPEVKHDILNSSKPTGESSNHDDKNNSLCKKEDLEEMDQEGIPITDAITLTTIDGEEVTVELDQTDECDAAMDTQIQEGDTNQQIDPKHMAEDAESNPPGDMPEGSTKPSQYETLYGCQFCEEAYSTVQELMYHYGTHTTVDSQFMCDECPCGFDEEESLVTHKTLIHMNPDVALGQKELVCKVCNKEFTYASNLRSHVKLHSKRLTCLHCSFSCRLRRDLKIHMESVHNQVGTERPLAKEELDQDFYKCLKCNKTFSMASRLRAHTESVHDKVKRYWCAVPGCTYGCYWKSDLKGHLQYHSSDKTCRRGSFKSSANEKKTYMCTLCNTVFLGMTAFLQHSQEHQHMLPSNSMKGFPLQGGDETSFSMTADDTIDANFAPVPKEVYPCTMCNAILQSKEGLDKHTVTHSENRPILSCSDCQKTFYHKSHLKTHIMLKHGDKKRYRCQEDRCFFSCYYYSDIAKHYKNKHALHCPSKEELDMDIS